MLLSRNEFNATYILLTRRVFSSYVFPRWFKLAADKCCMGTTSRMMCQCCCPTDKPRRSPRQQTPVWRSLALPSLVLLSLVVGQLGRSCQAGQTVLFSVDEEVPLGTVVGSLAQQLPLHLHFALSQLTFRAIQKDHAHLFAVEAAEGRVRVAKRLDRESLCPSPAPGDSIPLSAPARHSVARGGRRGAGPGDCLLRFSVNILRAAGAKEVKPANGDGNGDGDGDGDGEVVVGNSSSFGIADVMQVHVRLTDVNDHRCEFRPSARQTVYIAEAGPVGDRSAVGLHRPVDADTGPGNGVERASIRLLEPADAHDRAARHFELRLTETESPTSPYRVDLLVVRPLDYETAQAHQLVVEAGDADANADADGNGDGNGDGDTRSRSICRLQVTVNVVDVNDHAPRFEQKLATVSLLENASLEEPIYTFRAVDHDRGSLFSRLVFLLSPYAGQAVRDTFRVVPGNGSVLLRRPLRHSEQAVFEVAVLVRNPSEREAELGLEGVESGDAPAGTEADQQPGNYAHDTAKLVVNVVDVNNEEPVISCYTLSGDRDLVIEEEAVSLPADFAVVSVRDADSGLNGRVSCALARNSSSEFRLTQISGPDDAGALATDPADSGDSANSAAGGGHEESVYKLSTLRRFDREQTSHVYVEVVCRDEGSPARSTRERLRVRIGDVNDHSPVFANSTYRLSVTEDSDPRRRLVGHQIGQIRAQDSDAGANGRLRYRLEGAEAAGLFVVDPDDGMVRSTGRLDRELADRHRFRLVAEDQGAPRRSASASVVVDVVDYNDEAPRFGQSVYDFHVVENSPRGEFVGALTAHDPDDGVNAELTFKLVAVEPSPVGRADSLRLAAGFDEPFGQSPRPEAPIRITSFYDSTRGVYDIRLYTERPIDRESLPRPPAAQQLVFAQPDAQLHELANYPEPGSLESTVYQFHMMAEDGGSPKKFAKVLVRVHVKDVNDERPKFIFPTENEAVVALSYLEPKGFNFKRVRNPLGNFTAYSL
ncbi:unnamed protein product, partial [Protopolystoma xenopodis]